MRIALTSAVCALMAFLSVGCVVRPIEVVRAEPAPSMPVGEVIIVEPMPVERVYIYDRGYPPGTYVWNGYYYYGGYRYERNVFVQRVVNVNIQKNVYVNVVDNRQRGRQIEETHRRDFENHHGSGPGPKPVNPPKKKN
jgi:hypothetical protein